MTESGFPRLVSLACHDLRTPLATISGFAKTLTRAGELPARESRFVELIDAAAEQMTELLELLGLAARIEGGRYDPPLSEADTLELATSADEHVAASGVGETVETDPGAVRLSLQALAVAAARHGGIPQVTWTVTGRELVLAPLNDAATPVVTGEQPKDLGALVARQVLERLGATLTVDAQSLRVKL
jgi:signal transduction histidine kinase